MNVNQSRVKLYRRCQKAYAFRYDYPEILGSPGNFEMVPVRKKLPLYRGSWMHALQEALHYQWAGFESFEFKFGEGRGMIRETVENWKDVQEILTEEYEKLFEEERDELGDLPTECERLFKSYLRFWNDDQQRYSVATLPNGEPAIEFIVEADLEPFGLKGVKFKGKLDLLVEDDEYEGLWLWDAKWVKRIPAPDERMMSPQAYLYVWALRQMGLDIKGFLYNFGRTKPPTIPRLLKNGTLSVAQRMDTEYYTYLMAIKQTHGKYWKRYIPYYRDKLESLKGRDALWFDRARIPVEDIKVLKSVREYVASVRDIERRETRQEYVPRSYFYNCKFSCDYHGLCVAEFGGLNIEPLVKHDYQIVGERYEKEEDLLNA